jgi:hypothetical protein
MTIPNELLEKAGQLEATIGQVRHSVDEVLAARHGHRPNLTVRSALDNVDMAVGRWYRQSEQLKEELYEFGQRSESDRGDVTARIAGVTQLDIAVSADLALVAVLDDAIDRGPDRRTVRNALSAYDLPESAPNIESAAFGEGGLVVAVASPSDDQNATDQTAKERQADDGDTEAFSFIIDDVISDIVHRAGTSVRTVVFELGSGIGLEALHALGVGAVNIIPKDLLAAINRAARGVKRWVMVLVTAAARWLRKVFGQYFGTAIEMIISEFDVRVKVGDSLSEGLIEKLVTIKDVRSEAVKNLSNVPDKKHAIKRLRKLKKTHSRWVGPVGIVSRGLPALSACHFAGVPAAPIAGAGLLAWTLLFTGDQLDAQGPYPNIWKGVVRRAAGE